ncbi:MULTISPECIES: HdeD family acid-resistance protein [Rhodomicrobium]|uniref:HdeD family acid-resistance protein n=1 Tax=Rhodomicrobium TaxID=1068 RepID=UPI000B4AE978|nr:MULTISPECIES: HdeD family acid-resistance protein [Rhodomicrobium]
MSISETDAEKLRRVVAASVRRHWKLYLAEGIILLILGAAAIFVPPLATLAITIFLGWLFLISGIVGLVTTLYMWKGPGFFWSLVSAAISILAGILLLWWPVSGVFSLTLVLIVFFIFEGVVTIMYALEHRRELSERWGWMLASGIVDLILAGLILAGLPGTAAWALGLLVGINMIFGGTAMIAMALQAHKGGDDHPVATATPASPTPTTPTAA